MELNSLSLIHVVFLRGLALAALPFMYEQPSDRCQADEAEAHPLSIHTLLHNLQQAQACYSYCALLLKVSSLA